MDFPNVTTFADLGLAEVVLRAFDEEGYAKPTPIQIGAIPPVLEGKDLLGLAQTGTGKTAAFAAPIISRLVAENRRPIPKTARVLVLAPTRELAAQIADSFKAYGRFARISVACVFGGVGYGPQIQAMGRGLDVLVATPGRLLDHIERRTVDLSHTSCVVLDEADHMLDLGFVKPIRQIVGKLPKIRQSLFFSATMPTEIAGLAAEMLHKPVHVSVAPVAKTADRVAQRVIRIEAGAKKDLLAAMLIDAKYERTIVFTRTKRGADRVAEHLCAVGVEASAIHGNKSQGARQRALDGFKTGQVRVLVATDIAARGIDVDAVSHVFNFELPEVPEAYVHRIGRTARAGMEGEAISFCAEDERDLLRQIERLTKQVIPVEDLRGTRPVSPPRVARAPEPVEERPQQRQGRPGGRNGQPRREGVGKRGNSQGGEGRPFQLQRDRRDEAGQGGAPRPQGERQSRPGQRRGGRTQGRPASAGRADNRA
jgi:ATP-dependent RNA helicase RhlE